MKPGLSLRVSQHLALTPQLQQSIRLLQLSTLELASEVEQMLDENPFLERDDDAAPRLAPGHAIWWGFAGPSSYRFERGRLPTASIITSADDLARFDLHGNRADLPHEDVGELEAGEVLRCVEVHRQGVFADDQADEFAVR